MRIGNQAASRQRRILAGWAALLGVSIWTLSTIYYFSLNAAWGALTVSYMGFVGACAVVGLALFAVIFLVFDAARGMGRLAGLSLSISAVLAAITFHTIFDTLAAEWFLSHENLPTPRGMSRWMFQAVVNIGPITVCHVIYAAGLGLAIAGAAIREREMRLAKALAAAQEAQLAALRFQINPHFLFNTLNAVVSLVGAGRNPEAETVVGRLADFFRASLAVPPNAMVTLDEELDLMSSYLEIERARFGDRLTVEVDAPAELAGAEVPHFLIQPLIENAIKHGVAQTKGPVRVGITASRSGGMLQLAVEDDGAAGGEAAKGTGVGLANVAARLEALYGQAGEVTAAPLPRGFRVEVRLPLSFSAALERAAE